MTVSRASRGGLEPEAFALLRKGMGRRAGFREGQLEAILAIARDRRRVLVVQRARGRRRSSSSAGPYAASRVPSRHHAGPVASLRGPEADPWEPRDRGGGVVTLGADAPRFRPGARFLDALAYALRIHGGQARKGTDIPYLSHLLSVSALVMEHGGGEDEAVAALLHDAVEDDHAMAPRDRLRDIEEAFGERVASIVAGCTDSFERPREEWRVRKERYVRHLRETADGGILLVSCADKLHNARSILSDHRVLGRDLWRRFNAGADGELWYYGALLEAFRANPAAPPRLVEELSRVVGELQGLVQAVEGGGPKS